MPHTHEVTNQVPPHTGRDITAHPALFEALHREGAGWAEDEVRALGALGNSATVQEWGRLANEHPPVLHTHDRYGFRVDEVEYLPQYHELMRTAVEHGLHGAPWADDRPGAHADASGGQLRPVVQAIDLLDAVPLQHALVDHHLRPAQRLLGGLEDEHGGPGEIGIGGQIARRPQQHGGMAVMPAGVHPPLMRRDVRKVVMFVHRQGVHIGAQGDDATGTAPAMQDADHAGLRPAGRDLQPEAAQLVRDEGRGQLLLIAQLRTRMDMSAPQGDVVVFSQGVGLQIVRHLPSIGDKHGYVRKVSYRC